MLIEYHKDHLTVFLHRKGHGKILINEISLLISKKQYIVNPKIINN